MGRRALLPLILYAFGVWALCATTMGVGLSVTSLRDALPVHLAAAPVIAAALGLVYFRRPDARPPAFA